MEHSKDLEQMYCKELFNKKDYKNIKVIEFLNSKHLLHPGQPHYIQWIKKLGEDEYINQNYDKEIGDFLLSAISKQSL